MTTSLPSNWPADAHRATVGSVDGRERQGCSACSWTHEVDPTDVRLTRFIAAHREHALAVA